MKGQGRHLAPGRRCALLLRRAARRLGENDAWLAATKAQRLETIKSGRLRRDSVEMSEVTVNVTGDTAIVTGVNHIKGQDEQDLAHPTRPEGREDLVGTQSGARG